MNHGIFILKQFRMNTARAIVNASTNVVDCKKEGYTFPRCVAAEGARVITTTAAETAGAAMATIGAPTGPATVATGATLYAFSDKLGDYAAKGIKRSGIRGCASKHTQEPFVNIPKYVASAELTFNKDKYALPKTRFVPEIKEVLTVIKEREVITKETHNYHNTLNDAIVILNATGQHDLVKAAIVTSNLLKITTLLSNPLTYTNALSFIATSASLICTVFGEDEKDTFMQELSSLILSVFNGLMNRIDLLEKNMHIRFDAIEHKMDKQHYAIYMGLREIYYEGKTIEYIISVSHGDIVDGLIRLSKLADWHHMDLKTYFAMITDNLNSFRFEKINELISQIDYDIETGRLTDDRIHDYLAKLHNIITNILKHDHITGRVYLVEPPAVRLQQLRTTEPVRLTNYFTSLLGLPKVVNPVLYLVIDKYTNVLIEMLKDKRPFHYKMIEILDEYENEYSKFIQMCQIRMTAYVESKMKEIAAAEAKLAQQRSQFMTKQQELIMHRYRSFQDELNDSFKVLKGMNLFNWYTEEAIKMFHGSQNCKRIYDDYIAKKPGFVPFIKTAMTCTGSFCNGEAAKWYGGGPTHHGCTNADKDVRCRPYTRLGKKTDMTYISSHPENYVSTTRYESLSQIIQKPKNGYVRNYVNVYHKDSCLKLPTPTITIQKLPLEWNCGYFTIDCYIKDTHIDLVINFVESSSGKLHKIQNHTTPIPWKPSVRSNTHEVIMDYYMGGIVAKNGEGVTYTTWNWDRSPNGYVATYNHDYPESYDISPGIIDKPLNISPSREFVDTLEKLVSEKKAILEKTLAETVDSKEIQQMKELLECEQKIVKYYLEN